MGRPLLVYSLLRVALFALATGVCLFVLRLSLPISVVLGVVASSLGALTLLRSQRDEVTSALMARRQAGDDAKARRRSALDDPDADPDSRSPGTF